MKTTESAKPAFKPAKLKDLVFFQRGFDITKAQQKDGPYPVISSSGTNSFHNEYKVPGPGIVIGRKGTLGSVHFSPGNYWPHDTTLWSKQYFDNDPRFIYYFLQTLNLAKYDVGSSNPTLNRNHIHDLEIKIPAPFVQHKIASILSGYDDLIDNNRKRMALLEKAARLLYEEWFVRLQFPGHEHTPVVEGVPQGWDKGIVSDVLELQRGFDLPIQDRNEGVIPIYAASGINGFHSEAKVDGPGVITGRSGTIGKVLYAPVDFWPLNTSLWVKKYKVGGPLFAYQFLQFLGLEKLNGGVSVPSLDRKVVHSQTCLIPAKMLVHSFEASAKPIHQQIENLTRANQKLQQARDLLLPRLMSGELAV